MPVCSVDVTLQSRFNRTFMELKLELMPGDTVQVSPVLIVPLWN